MRDEFLAVLEPRAGYGLDEVDVVLDRLFGFGVRPLRLEEAVFESVLDRWRAQQRSRANKDQTIETGVWLVRRLREHAEAWPWQWRAFAGRGVRL